MDWLLIIVLAAAAAVVTRIFMSVRKVRRAQTDDWDSKVIERLRAQGSDPFRPYQVDFFFAMPTESTSRSLAATLEAEGLSTDLKEIQTNVEYPFSLHGSKSMRLSPDDMREHSRRFTALATASGGRYDGWTAR